MLWAFYWAQVALAVLGVYLLWAGLRGRESGDDHHPRCKRCGYDLYGLATAGRVCPECGADLRSPRAVRVGGVAQRNWRLVGLALVCGLFAYTLGPVRQLAWRAWVLRPATFVAAVKAGNEHVVNSLLNADPKLARIRPSGQTLLDLAVSAPRPEGVLMRLLSAGADPNEVGSGDGYRPLHRAAWENKPGAAQVLLAGGADANVRDGKGEAPLHFAARGPGPGSVPKILLDKGADPNVKDNGGRTPLHSAAAGRDPAVLQVLLNGGADVNAASAEGRTALHVAMASRNRATSLALVKAGADLSAKDKAGKVPAQLAREAEGGASGGGTFVAMVYQTALRNAATADRIDDVRRALRADPVALKEPGPDGPLIHVAVSLRQTALVKVLLECGADAAGRDGDGKTPLHRAAWGHDPPTVSALLAAKADPNAKDREGRTPLHVAADSPARGRTAEVLMEGGADAGAKDKDGITPLELAATSFHDDRDGVINAMLEKGASPDVFAAVALGREQAVRELLDRDKSLVTGGPGTHRATPLHVAAVHGHVEIAKLLLDRGADVNAGEDAGTSAATSVATHPATQPATRPATQPATRPATRPTDTAGGGSGDASEYPGRTPLFDALGRKQHAVAELLLERGARVDVRNNLGVTPLHVAALAGGGEPAVRLVLKYKADPNAPDPAGQTPLHLAAGYGSAATVRALLEAGADATAKDKAGLTPVDHAKRFNPRPDVAKVLEEVGTRQNPDRYSLPTKPPAASSF